MRGHLPDTFPSSGAQARHLPPKGEGFFDKQRYYDMMS